MNEYLKLKEKHQEEINSFPMAFAFSDAQLQEGLKKLNATIEEVCSVGAGGFIKKTDSMLLKNMYKKHQAEIKEVILADTTGEGYIRNMFEYELANHEYSYTMDATDTLDCLGLSVEDIVNNPALANGFRLAGGCYL